MERPTRPHQQVQLDVWGKYRVASRVNKCVFAVSLVDVATGHMVVYCRKTHTGAGLVECLQLYQGDLGCKIECLRTDNAPEMSGDVVQSYLAKERIVWQRSTPYVHEELGHVERRWGMLVPMARTMLLRAQNMSVAFWEDAMLYAAWILNRVPDKSHAPETACTGEASTPHERRLRLDRKFGVVMEGHGSSSR